MKSYNRVLTIAGSDSGGGAGIQADLKTFSACGCFGMSAITAITAQNSLGVSDIHGIPPATITAQIIAVMTDLGADAIKIGMLHSTEVIEAVAEALHHHSCSNIVVDPVMVATSGDRLIQEEAVSALKEILLPMATLITPNIPETEILLGATISTNQELAEAAEQLGRLYSTAILAKGGHLAHDRLMDILWISEEEQANPFENKRIETTNSHGTGCTLSSAIASFLARGKSMTESVRLAENYLHQAIISGAGFSIGKGHGPVNHFHELWKD